MTCVIYSLSDPRDNHIRYIGKTHEGLYTRNRKRMNIIRAGFSDTYCSRWIKSLLKLGLEPSHSVIEEIPDGDDWEARERYWISHYRETHKLTNLTDGGEGVPGYKLSDDHKKKISRTRKERIASGLISLNHIHSKQAREKAAAKHRGMKRSEEARRKLAMTWIGRHHSEESKAKISSSKRSPNPSYSALKTRAYKERKRLGIEVAPRKGVKLPEWWCKKLSDGQRQYRAKLAAMQEGVTTIPKGSRAKRPEAPELHHSGV